MLCELAAASQVDHGRAGLHERCDQPVSDSAGIGENKDYGWMGLARVAFACAGNTCIRNASVVDLLARFLIRVSLGSRQGLRFPKELIQAIGGTVRAAMVLDLLDLETAD